MSPEQLATISKEREVMLREWIVYNPLTHTYDTKDGTSVDADIVDNVQCFADVLNIAKLRANQRVKNEYTTT